MEDKPMFYGRNYWRSIKCFYSPHFVFHMSYSTEIPEWKKITASSLLLLLLLLHNKT